MGKKYLEMNSALCLVNGKSKGKTVIESTSPGPGGAGMVRAKWPRGEEQLSR